MISFSPLCSTLIILSLTNFTFLSLTRLSGNYYLSHPHIYCTIYLFVYLLINFIYFIYLFILFIYFFFSSILFVVFIHPVDVSEEKSWFSLVWFVLAFIIRLGKLSKVRLS